MHLIFKLREIMNELTTAGAFWDPAIFLQSSTWISLLTLLILEIVLGVDNLVFIAILSNRLPPKLRKKARVFGLSLALVMRIGLLSIVSILMRFTDPVFTDLFFNHSFSVQNLVMLFGGFFLLWKATSELHERLEGADHTTEKTQYASFWVVVLQIIALDAVFSLDAVITAQHMADHLIIMMLAVGLSMVLMILAAGVLTEFVNRHPTIVILCLSFLLMIGLSLVAEGFGFHIPKNYLYAAIGFSILIEIFNQVFRKNIQNQDSHIPMRERVANRILQALGTAKAPTKNQNTLIDDAAKEEFAFGDDERFMVHGVLTLSERNVRSIMTPRNEVNWINIEDDPQKIKEYIIDKRHNYFPVCQGNIDEIIGVARAKDLLSDLLKTGTIDLQASVKEPILVHRSTSILKMMETFRHSHGKIVMLIDEFGSVQGLLSLIDVFEAIAGEFPDENEMTAVTKLGDHHWQIEGSCDLYIVEQTLRIDGLIVEDEEYTSLAGFLLAQFGELPEKGASILFAGYRMIIREVDAKRIVWVDIHQELIEEGI